MVYLLEILQINVLKGHSINLIIYNYDKCGLVYLLPPSATMLTNHHSLLPTTPLHSLRTPTKQHIEQSIRRKEKVWLYSEERKEQKQTKKYLKQPI